MRRIVYLIMSFWLVSCSISKESALKKIKNLQEKYDVHGDGSLNISENTITKKDFNGLYKKIENSFATRPDFMISDLNDGSTKNYFYNKNKIEYLTKNGLIQEGMILLKDSSEIAKFKETHHLD